MLKASVLRRLVTAFLLSIFLPLLNSILSSATFAYLFTIFHEIHDKMSSYLSSDQGHHSAGLIMSIVGLPTEIMILICDHLKPEQTTTQGAQYFNVDDRLALASTCRRFASILSFSRRTRPRFILNEATAEACESLVDTVYRIPQIRLASSLEVVLPLAPLIPDSDSAGRAQALATRPPPGLIAPLVGSIQRAWTLYEQSAAITSCPSSLQRQLVSITLAYEDFGPPTDVEGMNKPNYLTIDISGSNLKASDWSLSEILRHCSFLKPIDALSPVITFNFDFVQAPSTVAFPPPWLDVQWCREALGGRVREVGELLRLFKETRQIVLRPGSCLGMKPDMADLATLLRHLPQIQHLDLTWQSPNALLTTRHDHLANLRALTIDYDDFALSFPHGFRNSNLMSKLEILQLLHANDPSPEVPGFANTLRRLEKGLQDNTTRFPRLSNVVCWMREGEAKPYQRYWAETSPTGRFQFCFREYAKSQDLAVLARDVYLDHVRRSAALHEGLVLSGKRARDADYSEQSNRRKDRMARRK